MTKQPLILLGVLFFMGISTISAQSSTIAPTGIIKGKVKDSVYTFVMSSATVAVYKAADSSLLRFTLPNNFGEFVLQPLPVETPLKLVITHVGYKPFSKKITIPKDKPVNDLGWVYMYQADSANALNDVVVTAIAPVRMNGDTIEFNADAFRLDSNATAEDLLRKLPGFTVWGDGDITYNGKEIKQLLVDGKPFLGGTDFTAATQNLPKDALDKVQVYQQRDEKNPLDSTMFANLKLKDDKKMGHFGKVSGGYGTDKHYAADGMLTGFNKKIQLSAAAAANNVNKMAYNTDMLIKNASYKGVGANTDYQSDFSMAGLNQPLAAGMKFQYDFIPDPQYRKQSRLNTDYFFRRNDAANIHTATTNRFLGADSVLSTLSNTTTHGLSNRHGLNAHYLLNTQQSTLNISSSFSAQDMNASSENSSQQRNNGAEVSSNSSRNTNQNNSNNVQMSAEYNHSRDWTGKQTRIPTDFTVRYSFSLDNGTGSGRTRSAFQSVADPAEDKIYDRLYDRKDRHNFSQTIYAEYPNLTSLLFGRARAGGIRMSLNNTLNLSNGSAFDRILDLDTIAQQYRINNYLTNDRAFRTVDENPALIIAKSFDKTLTNRYSKSFSLTLNLKEQYYSFHHTATQEVQDMDYEYKKFVPDFSLSYYNHQYGSYEIHANVNAQASASYPTINQLAPLTDSTSLLNIYMGNKLLKPEYEKGLNINFDIKSRKPKNPWEISAKGSYGLISDNTGDSIIYTNVGQTIHYAVNLDGAKHYSGGFSYRKALEAANNTYRLQLNYDYSLYQSPGYINNIFNLSNSTNNGVGAHLDYSHLDRVTLRLEEGITYYTSEQHGFNNSSFKNKNLYTRFSGALQLPKDLVWSSNITLNRSSSGSSTPINYTIWNASLAYRFLHGNRGEAKFSAMDLLHQNKGIINKAVGNVQTIGYNNVLQQYFMLTLAYYPRKFGK